MMLIFAPVIRKFDIKSVIKFLYFSFSFFPRKVFITSVKSSQVDSPISLTNSMNFVSFQNVESLVRQKILVLSSSIIKSETTVQIYLKHFPRSTRALTNCLTNPSLKYKGRKMILSCSTKSSSYQQLYMEPYLFVAPSLS